MLTYGVVRDDTEALISLLKKHEALNNEKYYYEIRNLDRDPETFSSLSKTEKAARIIYLNKTGYNGLYRVNSKGHFNVPFGRYRNPPICEEAALLGVSRYLNSGAIQITNTDFERAVASADKDSFVYFDPPYHSAKKSGFACYQADGFGEREQERLRDLVMELTGRKVKCLLSNADTEYIRGLYNYDCFSIVSVEAKRTINSNAAKRGNVGELLIKNWKD